MAEDDHARFTMVRSDGKRVDVEAMRTFTFREFFGSQIESERLQLLPDEIRWDDRYVAPERPVETVLQLGCGVQYTPHLMLEVVEVFKALGVDFRAVAGRQWCCGKIWHIYGQPEAGQRIATSSTDRLASYGAPVVVQWCGSCQIQFDKFVTDAAEARGEEPVFTNVHVTEFLLQRLLALGDRVPWRASVKRRVLVHGHTRAVHEQQEKDRDCAVQVLNLIPGVDVADFIEPSSLGTPCAAAYPGGPSSMAELSVEEYRLVQAEFEVQARAAGADTVASVYHLCHREWGKFASPHLPFKHYISILAEALGCAQPDRNQALWRLGDLDAMVQASRPRWEVWGIEEGEARRLLQKFFVSSYAEAVPQCP